LFCACKMLSMAISSSIFYRSHGFWRRVGSEKKVHMPQVSNAINMRTWQDSWIRR
jgi:hypothetical protein